MNKSDRKGQIYIVNNRHAVLVQTELFRLGYRWNGSGTVKTEQLVGRWIVMFEEDKYPLEKRLMHFGSEDVDLIIVTLMDLIVYSDKPQMYKGLTSNYDVHFDWLNNQCNVGCHTVQFHAIDDLYKVIQQYRIK